MYLVKVKKNFKHGYKQRKRDDELILNNEELELYKKYIKIIRKISDYDSVTKRI